MRKHCQAIARRLWNRTLRIMAAFKHSERHYQDPQCLMLHPAGRQCLTSVLPALQDAWNLRGTFSLSVGILAAALVPLFAIFVRYSDKLSYRLVFQCNMCLPTCDRRR